MSQRRGMEWTDATWNPVRDSKKVGLGRARCGAEMRGACPWVPCRATAVDRTLAVLGISLLLLVPEVATAGTSWTGTVRVESANYGENHSHTFTLTIALHLKEGPRVLLPGGGFRVPLSSDGTTYEQQNEVRDLMDRQVCSGSGSERLADRVLGYLETKGEQTTYHLLIPRAYGSFGCGRNQAIKRNRVAIIGRGDPEPEEIEIPDALIRRPGKQVSVMEGSFETRGAKDIGGGHVRWEHKIRWFVERDE